MAESGTDVDSRNRNWNWTLTGTGLVSRIDVIGLFVDPELELMFLSLIDVIGLVVDPGPRLLGWNWDLDCLAGPRQLGRNRNGTGESDRCDRTLRGSGTGTYVSESDRGDRTRSGSGTFSAWLEPGPSPLDRNQDLDSLAGTGTELVSRIDVIGLFVDPEQELMFLSLIDVIGLVVDPGPSLLGWNRDLLRLTGTRTSTAWLELVSRIDVIGLFLDPEQELMFLSLIDVIGLVVDPGPSLLGWTFSLTAWLDLLLDCLAGPFPEPEQ